MKFEMGMLVATPGVLAKINDTDAALAVRKHLSGDWGDLDDEDKKLNDAAIVDGGRILSAYRDRNDNRFWVITEATRGVTTILLTEEY